MTWSKLPIRRTIATALQRFMSQGPGGISVLVSGPSDMAQEEIARHLARAAFCERQDGDVCEECNNCRRTAARTYPDYFIIEPSKATHAIDDLREVIEQANYQPTEGLRRILLVHKADRMQDPAANCLLKSLEEPPGHIIFVLSTDHIEKILPTIISRCRHIKLAPLAAEELSNWLTGTQGLAAPQAETIANLAGGKPEFAMRLADEDINEERDAALDLLSAIRLQSALKISSMAQSYGRDRTKARALLITLLSFIRDGLIICENMGVESLIHADRREKSAETWKGSSGDSMVARFEATAEGIRRIDANHNIQATLENVFRTYIS